MTLLIVEVEVGSLKSILSFGLNVSDVEDIVSVLRGGVVIAAVFVEKQGSTRSWEALMSLLLVQLPLLLFDF